MSEIATFFATLNSLMPLGNKIENFSHITFAVCATLNVERLNEQQTDYEKKIVILVE